MHPSTSRLTALAASLFVTVATAQNGDFLSSLVTVLPIPVATTPGNIYASVMIANYTATEYAFACEPTVTLCKLDSKHLTYTQGGPNLEYHFKEEETARATPLDVKLNETCTNGPSEVVCTRTLVYSTATIGKADTWTTNKATIRTPLAQFSSRTVTITAGLEKLTRAAGVTTPTPTTPKGDAVGAKMTQQAIIAGVVAAVGGVLAL